MYLPGLVAESIVGELDIVDLLALRCSSKAWRELVDENLDKLRPSELRSNRVDEVRSTCMHRSSRKERLKEKSAAEHCPKKQNCRKVCFNLLPCGAAGCPACEMAEYHQPRPFTSWRLL